jgi:hypothetical protein
MRFLEGSLTDVPTPYWKAASCVNYEAARVSGDEGRTREKEIKKKRDRSSGR